MELKMQEYQLPERVGFNYEELKAELQEKTKQYEMLIYSDEQIKEAKADKANLNKLKKALNDERIRLQKAYMQPFNEFKARIDELVGIIDRPVTLIDKQIKDVDERKKAEKKEKILELFKNTVFPDWVKFERIFDAKWLNSSVSIASITKELIARCEQIENNLSTLSSLPEFSFEAVEVYKTTLDVNKAINEGKRLAEIQKRKAEAERIAAERKAEVERMKAEANKQQEEQIHGQIAFKDAESFDKNCIVPKAESRPESPMGQAIESIERQAFERCMNPPVEEREWVGFKAYLSEADAQALAGFFATRGIQYALIEI